MKGIIVIITSPDGHVQGVAGNFEQGSPGGMRTKDMQEMRARDKAWRQVFDAHCSDDVAKALQMTQFTMRDTAARLRALGWKDSMRELTIGEKENDD